MNNPIEIRPPSKTSRELPIAFVIFTYPKDYDYAVRCTESIHESMGKKMPDSEYVVYWCVHEEHADAANCRIASLGDRTDGGRVEIKTHDFNAGGSLRWSNALHGMIKVFDWLSEKHPIVVKIDSDAILFKPDVLLYPIYEMGNHLVGMRRYATDSETIGNAPKGQPYMNLITGVCYALHRFAVENLKIIPPEMFDQIVHEVKGHEDLFFSRALHLCDPVFCSYISRELAFFKGEYDKVDDKTIFMQDNARKDGRVF